MRVQVERAAAYTGELLAADAMFVFPVVIYPNARKFLGTARHFSFFLFRLVRAKTDVREGGEDRFHETYANGRNRRGNVLTLIKATIKSRPDARKISLVSLTLPKTGSSKRCASCRGY